MLMLLLQEATDAPFAWPRRDGLHAALVSPHRADRSSHPPISTGRRAGQQLRASSASHIPPRLLLRLIISPDEETQPAAMRILVGVKRVIDYAVKVRVAADKKGALSGRQAAAWL
jgi:hypothetical protein